MGRAGEKTPLISPGYQNQFGVETNLITVLYLLVSMSLVGLSKVKLAKGIMRFAVFFVLMSMFLVSYSMVLKVFRIKNEGYQFKLLF